MSPLRIVLFSHDSRGLGRTSRALAIASKLAEDFRDSSILLLTDLPIIGRFRFPQQVDCVRLPAVAEPLAPRSRDTLNVTRESTLRIRRRIIHGVAKAFKPDVFIVERDPCDLHDEMRRALSFLREEVPHCKIVWGLLDVIGDPEMVIQDWSRHRVSDLFGELCDELWVHGDRELFDHAREYRLPKPAADKLVYTGYLQPDGNGSSRVSSQLGKSPGRPAVVITVGGGAHGYPLIDNYLGFLERLRGSAPFQSIIVSGPMMLGQLKADVIERARRLEGVIVHRFSKYLSEYLRRAQLVVFTGGYNTHCANLAYHKQAIVSPAPGPPNEHLLRAQVFTRLGIVDLLTPAHLSPDRLGAMVSASISRRATSPYDGLARPIAMDGLDQIGARVQRLVG